MSAARPLISIVTPTLNQANFIEFTIRSIKGQTMTDFEHIVVDGGSTDGTQEILRHQAQTYPLRWVSGPDGGMYEAINKGMAMANGRILAYLNSDDLYFPWTLEVVAAAFEARPRADLVHGDALNVDHDTGRQRLYLEPPYERGWLTRHGSLAQPAVFWRRHVFESLGGFDASLRYVADLDFWLRAGERHRFAKVNECLAVERDHRATLRAGSEGRMEAEVQEVRARALSIAGVPPLSRVASVRPRAWYRAAWMTLAIQTVLPLPLRLSPWRRFVAASAPDIRRRQALRASLLVGRERPPADDALFPSKRWLTPT